MIKEALTQDKTIDIQMTDVKILDTTHEKLKILISLYIQIQKTLPENLVQQVQQDQDHQQHLQEKTEDE